MQKRYEKHETNTNRNQANFYMNGIAASHDAVVAGVRTYQKKGTK